MYDIIIGRSEKDREKYGLKGTILLGKHYIKMGRVTSLSNRIYLDVATSHVVFICGKRGGGKCLHEDSIITLHDGSQVPIKELENDNREIMALGDDFKISNTAKTEFFKRPVNKLLNIKLRSGKQIKVTPEHPLLTVKGWVPAENLAISSRIATPRIIPAFGKNMVDEHKVKIMAYLIAEGHMSNGFVIFSNNDDKIVRDFRQSVHEFDENLEIKRHSKNDCYRVVKKTGKRTTKNAKRDSLGKFIKGSKFDSKSPIRRWLDEKRMYGKLSREKVVPYAIFSSTKANISLFLNRLFSCDGTIYFDKNTSMWRISYASASEQLIGQVQHLLLKFGILSIIRKKKYAWELEIRGENICTYIKEIGFYGIKEKRAKKAIKESIDISRNPNTDIVPKEIWEIYRPKNWAEAGRKEGYSAPKGLRSSIDYSPSRQKLLQIAKADESEIMEQLACSDIFWDEIVSIEEMLGKFIVYDISVPEKHNFVANDIIVHNSYTMGAIAEGLADMEKEVKQNLSFILLDTMGIYWSMKYPNKPDEELLAEWGFKPKGLDVKIYTPVMYYKKYKEEGIPTDFPFSIKPSELDASDWQMTFDISPNDPLGVLIERVIYKLRKEKGDYSMEDIIRAIRADERAEQNVKGAAENRFLGTESWGVFSEKGTLLRDLAQGGQVTVLDVSCYATMPGGWKIKALIIGLVAQKLFIQRMIARKSEEYQSIKSAVHYFTEEEKKAKLDMPMVWLVIDEAHEFLPVKGKTAASDALITILREGRQPGISLIMATQQPGKIHTDVMTQSDTVLSHRITAKLDVDALGMLMQSYMREGLNIAVDNLPRVKGAAVLFDDTNERMYPMRVRPRFTWHGGSAPYAIPEEKKKL